MSQVSVSDSEWPVMRVIWNEEPLTAQDICARLKKQTGWTPSKVKVTLHRLVDKQVLRYERQGTRYVYCSQAQQADCVRQAGQSFLARVFAGDPVSLLSHFLRASKLTAEEIQELRKILNERKASSKI